MPPSLFVEDIWEGMEGGKGVEDICIKGFFNDFGGLFLEYFQCDGIL